MISANANFRWSVLLIGTVVTVFFLLNLPVTFIDRVQEHWYLGYPYELLKSGKMWITHDDPFPENGPHIIYLLAKATHLTGSLWAVRLLQWPWALAAITLLWLLLDRLTGFSREKPLVTLSLTLVGLFFWVTLPLGFVYPVQTNGMMHGFACVALGLLLLRKRAALAMIAFGFGYAGKAQFIMFFPCVIAYRLLLDYPGTKPGRHLLLVARDTLLLFAPTVVFLPLVFGILGFFRATSDAWVLALEGPDLLFAQMMGVLKKLAGVAAADPLANVRRAEILRTELASYSKLVYMHIAFSVSAGIAGLGWALKARLPAWWGKGAAQDGPPPELALLSVMACIAWLTYFRFNNYPYCYNMLPILPFNFLVMPYLLWQLSRRISASFFWKGTAGVFCVLMLFLSVRYVRHFAQDPPGDALKPYYWMQGKAWNSNWNESP